MQSACEWCKKHWKAIVTVIIAIAAVACLFIPGVNAIVAQLVIGKIILSAAVGALIGTGIGGVLGGLTNLAKGELL